MLRKDAPEDAAFRAEVRQWLEANIPEHLKHLTFRPLPEEGMQWYRKLSERGWIAPHWPREHGGMDATPMQQVILMEEMARAGGPDYPSQGLNHIGPILIKCGTEHHKKHLPAIISGDAIWCQGYSEPGAGSDLANIRTRAEIQGSELVINGHKIWTTWGHHADWMFALVRTSDDGPRQKGITFVLIDMNTPGITRRAIRTIANDDEFCEVFFDDVRVPIENVVGDIGNGWAVATALLSEERTRIGGPGLALKALVRLKHLAAHKKVDARFTERIAHAEIETEALIASYLSVAEAEHEGGHADSSYLKIMATETVQTILDILQDVAGEDAALRHAVRTQDGMLDYSEMFLQSRRLTIYGGSNEVQRSIIATRVLGMPTQARSKA